MSLATADLPDDIAALRAFALAYQGDLKAAQLAVQVKALEIEKLRFQITKLRRMQFGRSSERITRQIEQLELQLEELETGEAEDIARMEADERAGPIPQRTRPKRKPLPDHLPREEIVHQPEADGACVCPACGGDMGKLGEDVTRGARLCTGTLPGHPPRTPKICLPGVRCHHPGAGPGDADTARPRHPRDAGASAGLEILRPSAAVSPIRDLRA